MPSHIAYKQTEKDPTCFVLLPFHMNTSSLNSMHLVPSHPPLNFRIIHRRLTSITLAWQPPPESEQNGIITTYTVQVIPPVQSPFMITTTELSLTVSSLLGNSQYSFAVAASTVVGIGPYSSPSITTQTLRPGTEPFSLQSIHSRKV